MEFRPMSPDELQRTLQFLLNHQAQFAADFEKLSAKVDRLVDSVGATNEAVNGLTTIVGHTVGLMGELTLKIGRWAEQGRRTDERLDQLVDLFERHLRDDHDRPPS